jgi:hypothetical protein
MNFPVNYKSIFVTEMKVICFLYRAMVQEIPFREFKNFAVSGQVNFN